jgi:hypothetical protein
MTAMYKYNFRGIVGGSVFQLVLKKAIYGGLERRK